MINLESKYSDIRDGVTRMITQYKELVADGSLSFTDALTLMSAAAAEFVTLVAQIPESGEDKKQMVLDALGELFDSVIVPALEKQLPAWLAATAEKALKPIMLELLSGYIDTLVEFLKERGWIKKPEPTPPYTPSPAPFVPNTLKKKLLRK